MFIPQVTTQAAFNDHLEKHSKTVVCVYHSFDEEESEYMRSVFRDMSVDYHATIAFARIPLDMAHDLLKADIPNDIETPAFQAFHGRLQLSVLIGCTDMEASTTAEVLINVLRSCDVLQSTSLANNNDKNGDDEEEEEEETEEEEMEDPLDLEQEEALLTSSMAESRLMQKDTADATAAATEQGDATPIPAPRGPLELPIIDFYTQTEMDRFLAAHPRSIVCYSNHACVFELMYARSVFWDVRGQYDPENTMAFAAVYIDMPHGFEDPLPELLTFKVYRHQELLIELCAVADSDPSTTSDVLLDALRCNDGWQPSFVQVDTHSHLNHEDDGLTLDLWSSTPLERAYAREYEELGQEQGTNSEEDEDQKSASGATKDDPATALNTSASGEETKSGISSLRINHVETKAEVDQFLRSYSRSIIGYYSDTDDMRIMQAVFGDLVYQYRQDVGLALVDVDLSEKDILRDTGDIGRHGSLPIFAAYFGDRLLIKVSARAATFANLWEDQSLNLITVATRRLLNALQDHDERLQMLFDRLGKRASKSNESRAGPLSSQLEEPAATSTPVEATNNMTDEACENHGVDSTPSEADRQVSEVMDEFRNYLRNKK